MEKEILIVGGGFAGVRTALDLDRTSPGVKVTLVTERPHFEYQPGLYGIVSGGSPRHVCIPFAEIFQKTKVEVVVDRVISVDLSQKEVGTASGRVWKYGEIVLALGSEPAFFEIPGLQDLSFPLYSMHDAMRLNHHMCQDFLLHAGDKKEADSRIVVVGAGPAGVEIAAELALFLKKAALEGYSFPVPSITLIEGAPRILPMLPLTVAEKVDRRLRSLGVTIITGSGVLREDIETLYLKDMQMRTKTVVWTAGAKARSLYKSIPGLTFDQKGRVEVDDHLQAVGVDHVWIAGDGAATPFSGRAPGATADGRFVASTIARGKKETYVPHSNPFAIPVGTGWAIVHGYGSTVSGKIGWYVRRCIDLYFFLSILPFSKALKAWRSNKVLADSCPLCASYSKTASIS